MAVVGGGSTYTPELVDSLCDHEDRMEVDELVLLDPDHDRLEVVGGLARRMLAGADGPASWSPPTTGAGPSTGPTS